MNKGARDRHEGGGESTPPRLAPHLDSPWLGITLYSIGDAVIATDRDGVVTFLNPVAESLTGWTARNAVGQPIEDIVDFRREDGLEPVENPVARVLRGQAADRLEEHLILVSKEGAERPIDHSTAPIRDARGTVAGAVLVFRDVTESKKLERSLRASNQRKDEFLAMLSHELRSPLAPLLHAVELVRDARGEDRQELGEVIERQVKHLERLVDDLLDMSRVRTGRIRLRTARVDLREVVASAVDRVRPSVDERGQTLELFSPERPIWTEADSLRLEQVFGNLLNNALKYNEPGGSITVTLAESGSEAIVEVSDEGIGMDAELLSDVFDLFTQGHVGSGRSEGGLGIGLALARSLVESHGGAIEAFSEGAGQGSRFVVRLPVVAAPPEETSPGAAEVASPPETADSSCGSLRVLVVDDDRDAARTSSMLLTSWGHDVAVVHGGEEALDQAAAFRPHVILLDIGLPDIDGHEVARRLRQKSGCNGVQLIAITGYSQGHDRQRSADAGFDLHLVKPVDTSELKRLLARIRRG